MITGNWLEAQGLGLSWTPCGRTACRNLHYLTGYERNMKLRGSCVEGIEDGKPPESGWKQDAAEPWEGRHVGVNLPMRKGSTVGDSWSR